MVARCDVCVPCEKFRRKMSTPAVSSASSISGVLVAGPTVATILVWRMGGASLQSVSAMRQTIAQPVLDYLERHHPPLEPVLESIRAEGLAAGLPLVDAATARLLRALVISLGAGASSRSAPPSAIRRPAWRWPCPPTACC